jgi:hypothetical protein
MLTKFLPLKELFPSTGLELTDILQLAPESPESEQFSALQRTFATQYDLIFSNWNAAKTVIIIPSLTLDSDILHKIKGVNYYEERMLCMLMLLRMPHTQVVFISSLSIDPIIVDYYLHLLPGITSYHAKQRAVLLSCYDASKKSLTQKILDRPRLIERIRKSIPAGHLVHLACFNVTAAERKLAVALNAPVYGCDPDLEYLGNKSNGRKIFRSVGLRVADGYENLHTEAEIVRALAAIKQKDKRLEKAVVKINEGFSGEGNAIFSYRDAPVEEGLESWIKLELPVSLKIVAGGVSYTDFLLKFEKLGGIAEAFIEGVIKGTPSVQCRITPTGSIDIISTHDQITGGESGQVFLGATFPAHETYAMEIGKMGLEVSEKLMDYGVLGRFSIDFISVQDSDKWKGKYNPNSGEYFTRNGLQRFYTCTDNLQRDCYKGLTPHDLIEIATCNGLMYNASSQEGVMFHLISALSQYGKIGLLCIGATRENAEFFFNKTIAVLDKETSRDSNGCHHL